MSNNKIHIVFGSTASGKSAYAVKLAHKLQGEVINADSMQVYTELPILTAQPTEAEREGVPHHLYGGRSVNNPYSLGDYIAQVVPTIKEVRARGYVPILVGGTGMYLKALVEGMLDIPKASVQARHQVEEIIHKSGVEGAYHHLLKVDNETATELKPHDIQRIRRALEVYFTTNTPMSEVRKRRKREYFKREELNIIWLQRNREEIYKNINSRFDRMIENGVIIEVKKVLKYGSLLPRAHGLPELREYIYGNITLAEAMKRATKVIRNYAKRQITWARHQFNFDEIVTSVAIEKFNI